MKGKKNVTFHVSEEAKKELEKMAKDVTHTEQGRSVTISLVISYAKLHYEDFKKWCNIQKEITK